MSNTTRLKLGFNFRPNPALRKIQELAHGTIFLCRSTTWMEGDDETLYQVVGGIPTRLDKGVTQAPILCLETGIIGWVDQEQIVRPAVIEEGRVYIYQLNPDEGL